MGRGAPVIFAWLQTSLSTRRRSAAFARFAVGNNLDLATLNTRVAEEILNATAFAGEQVFWDLHVGLFARDDVEVWTQTLAGADAMMRRVGSRMRLGVLEENGDTHDLSRALGRVRYANFYARAGERFTYGSTANGLQVFGQNDNGWDQGAVFLHPGATWLSPLGLAVQLVGESSEPRVLQTDVAGAPAGFDALALRSEDGARTVLRVVNPSAANVTATVRGACAWTARQVAGLPNAVNPPSDPRRLRVVETNGTGALTFPPTSIAAVDLHPCAVLV